MRKDGDKIRRNTKGKGRRFNKNDEKDKIEEKVVLIKRLSKKTRGGNYISFSALVAVGDRKGKIGIGLKRGLEVPQAIRKAIKYARKNMITVPLYKQTIPHSVKLKYKAAYIMLKPAPRGVGLKVGSVARSILSLAGVTNASGKLLRSRNQITNTYAVMKALGELRSRKKNI